MKPFTNIDQQVEIILQRGLLSRTLDEEKLRAEIKHRLQYVNYYRLSAYWHCFLSKESDANGRQHFIKGTFWEDIWARYSTDRRLRIMLLEAVSRFEIALRAKIAYHWVAFSNLCTTPQSLPNKYMVSMNSWSAKKKVKAERERRDLEEAIQKNFERNCVIYADIDPSVTSVKYAKNLPAWSYVEFATLGNFCTLLRVCLPQVVVKKVAHDFGFNNASFFCSAVSLLKDVRNACAHQARILDRRWITTKKNLILRRDNGVISSIASIDKTSAAICLCALILGTIAPESTWKSRCKQLVLTALKTTPHLNGDLGFKLGWDKHPMWR